MRTRMRMVVGLGNPGQRFERTRHNAGYAVIDRLAMRWRIEVDRCMHQALVGTARRAGEPVLLAKPQTFMNASGDAVRAVCLEHSIATGELIVVHDDVDVAAGRVKLRAGGGAGGHRGVESIVDALGNAEFLRVKVGVGRPPQGVDTTDWVLSEPAVDDESVLGASCDAAAAAVEIVLDEGPARAMERFNQREAVHGGSPL